jgi:hypothetical protein
MKHREGCPSYLCGSADSRMERKGSGLGDMSLGHRLLGAFEMVGSIIVWLVVISMAVSGKTEDLVMGGIILFFYNCFDGVLTYHMARKGYMLAYRPSEAA